MASGHATPSRQARAMTDACFGGWLQPHPFAPGQGVCEPAVG